MKDKKLLLMVGLPYSGKSTKALELSKNNNAPIVCPDEIRLALHGQRFVQEAEPYVWAIAKTMVKALFSAGHNIVILDACNTSNKRRNAWLSDDWTCEYFNMKTSKEECLKRAESNNDSIIVPVIERMSYEFEEV